MSAVPAFQPETWAAHPSAAPLTSRSEEGFTTAANGTRTCAGGWQFVCEGIVPEVWYEIRVDATHAGIAEPRDFLLATLHWERLARDEARVGGGPWTYLLPTYAEGRAAFRRIVRAPAGASCLTVRLALRWTPEGEAVWSLPSVRTVPGPGNAESGNTRIAVVTGDHRVWPGHSDGVAHNVDTYAGLCADACRACRPDLIVLPEICVQRGMGGRSPIDTAVPVPGPETEPFSRVAREAGCHIVLGVLERDGDAVRNTAALIGPDGSILGKYRKVHLAVGGEAESGLLPGDGFPVFATPVGRIGCTICMDSSAEESARLVGLNGADILALPIMGDHRADRRSRGQPVFNESRWFAIMRTRAMDNQLTMAVARNTAIGSCIIDSTGEVLAHNEGDMPFIHADVPRRPRWRTWNGGCFRDVNWMQRRPHLYGPFVDGDNLGGLTDVEAVSP